jgi:hypothetical protein
MDYKKIYDDLMLKARSENRVKNIGVYYEAHHIIPRCLGGEGTTSQWSTHPNIILLTAKEHFVAHKLLCEIYPNNDKLNSAYWLMVIAKSDNQDRNYKITSREYERIKSEIAEDKKILYSGYGNPNFGKNCSDFCKKRTIEVNSGKYGWNNPNGGIYLNILTGIYYTIHEIKELTNIKGHGYISSMVNGKRPNKINIIKV